MNIVSQCPSVRLMAMYFFNIEVYFLIMFSAFVCNECK